jgi:hypothetical protein
LTTRVAWPKPAIALLDYPADVALSSTFGPNMLLSFKVWTDEGAPLEAIASTTPVSGRGEDRQALTRLTH